MMMMAGTNRRFVGIAFEIELAAAAAAAAAAIEEVEIAGRLSGRPWPRRSVFIIVSVSGL